MPAAAASRSTPASVSSQGLSASKPTTPDNLSGHSVLTKCPNKLTLIGTERDDSYEFCDVSSYDRKSPVTAALWVVLGLAWVAFAGTATLWLYLARRSRRGDTGADMVMLGLAPLLTVDFLLSVLGAVAGGWLAVRLDGLGPRLIAGIGAAVLLARLVLGVAQTWWSRSAE